MGRSVAEAAEELAALVERIGPQLRRFLLGVTKDVHAAEDAAQAAFAKALEKPPQGPPEALKAWIFKVALNEALARRRTEQRLDGVVRKLRWLRIEESTDGSSVEVREIVERVQAEIDRLPAEQRLVVRERLSEEKTFAEIAKEQGLPLGTVLTRMRLALERLRTKLGDLD